MMTEPSAKDVCPYCGRGGRPDGKRYLMETTDTDSTLSELLLHTRPGRFVLYFLVLLAMVGMFAFYNAVAP
jgi:hypothetical protein